MPPLVAVVDAEGRPLWSSLESFPRVYNPLAGESRNAVKDGSGGLSWVLNILEFVDISLSLNSDPEAFSCHKVGAHVRSKRSAELLSGGSPRYRLETVAIFAGLAVLRSARRAAE